MGGTSPRDAAPRRRSPPARPAGGHSNAVLDASPNAIVAVGTDGRIAYANPQAAETFGWEPEELVGQPVEILLPDHLRERHIGHRDGFRGQATARPMGIGLDLSGRRRDGSEFPVEISLSPVGSGAARLVYATVVDITARKAAERALAASERRFRTVLEASPNAIVAVDQTGRIVYTNPRVDETFGYPAGQLIGQPIERLLPERLATRHLAHRQGFFERPTARPMGIGLDLAGRRRDGSEFPVEISLSPVDTADGRLVFATVADITARKGLEGQLLQAQKMESIGRLAGGIAHDFNNMLSAIRGYADLILMDLAAGDPAALDLGDLQASVQAIHSAADRAATLTGQLLAFSRQQVLTPKVIDVRSTVTSIEPMLRRLIGENVRLVLALDPATGRVRADPSQIDQIIVNLVVNARDAMPGGGTVTVETGNTELSEPYAAEHFDVTPGPYVVLAVSDNGIGMDRETKEHIFEPFFTTKEHGKGTGLGLATIYGIVRQSGGHIWLYSEPGLGTAFKLFFPRVHAPAERAGEPEVGGREQGSGTILLAEDEQAVREFTVRVLYRAGYTVLAAPDAMEALEIADRHRSEIVAVVSDVVMPGMSGTELVQRIRERYPEIGIVLLSGYTAETLDLADILASGARFVGKPFTPDALVRAVGQAIEAAGRLSRPAGREAKRAARREPRRVRSTGRRPRR